MTRAVAAWFMLHSGSRGVGNAIGTMFIELAKQDALRHNANLPDRDLAYFEKGSRHFGDYVRAVAVSAKAGELGIIPGSMGARSYIVRGKGNADSFESCSHGAGRVMSRSEAKRRFTLADHRAATDGVECRNDKDVIDETPRPTRTSTR
jgi:RNA-splicing ligase RtcB